MQRGRSPEVRVSVNLCYKIEQVCESTMDSWSSKAENRGPWGGVRGNKPKEFDVGQQGVHLGNLSSGVVSRGPRLLMCVKTTRE